MDSAKTILNALLNEKRAQLQVKSKRKASLDAEVLRLENEVIKLEAHIKKAYPIKEGA